jgi:V-type H+-transporting ATPase subunit F
MDESGKLVAVIGDEDTVVGFVLAGVGHRTSEGQNFLIVKPGETELAVIEETFRSYSNREDIGIILINQHVSKYFDCLCRIFIHISLTIGS